MTSPLITHLSNAVNSLENNISFYNWNKAESCNCGIVLQSCLGVTHKELKIIHNKEKTDSECENYPTWLFLIQNTCSSTGVPVKGIFSQLYSLGFYPEDFTHLEYLNNPAIIGGIPYDTRIKYMAKPVPKLTKFWDWITGSKTPQKYKTNMHQKKISLILYLKSWIQILKEDFNTSPNLPKIDIEKNILRAKSLGYIKKVEEYQLEKSVCD